MTRLLNKLNVVAQGKLERKPWDKMLFDMRMVLGKGHYENLSIQYTENFVSLKSLKKHWKSSDNFKMFAQNIYCGYTLKPPRRGRSNEYQHSLFWNTHKKRKIGIPLSTLVLLYKSGV